MEKQHYTDLSRIFLRLSRFSHLNAMASWDMATMMPVNGSQARREALAELSVLRHQILSDKKIARLIRDAEQENLDDIERANLNEIIRQYQNAILLPDSLVEEKSLVGSRCEYGWRTQRADNNWPDFATNLKEVVRVSREEARLRADAQGISPYDALLDIYEPGMTSAKLDSLFGSLRSWLPDLLQTVLAKQAAETVITPVGPFATEKQRQLGLDTMNMLGFDFAGGRLDVSAHPFCSGVPEDVRITTRYNENELLGALYAIIHETGHARYEQNLPRTWPGQPVALASSMAIHESQSLFFERQLGRSTQFQQLLLPKLIAHFGPQPAFELSNLVKLTQRVECGFIRVYADEISYPAHVVLRYEIERALISGDIEVDDIPALWDEKMQQWLGLSTAGNYRNGCMQDIHWTDGAFGYFSSYTLGAMYAAQLFAAASRALPQLENQILCGDFAPLFTWLEQNIWRHGRRFSTSQLITNATGEDLNPLYFRKHLESRYL